jgi:pimeloyl-ACP methyl ester carboxylesterase
MNAPRPTPTFERTFHEGLCVHRRPASIAAVEAAPRTRLHFAHANGFHAQTYAPLLACVDPGAEVLAMDLRGHGQSTAKAVPDDLVSWDTYADDLRAYLETVPGPLVLAGHSLGAIVSIKAASALGDRVRGLLLVEPVVIPRPIRFAFSAARALGLAPKSPLARAALRRKWHFESPEAALHRYEGRGAFSSWQSSFVQSYVAHGLHPRSSGGVRLACHPAWEARTFATAPLRPLAGLEALRCPVTVLVAEQGSTCPPASVKELGRLAPGARVRRLEGASHFLPMERPEIVLGELDRLLRLAEARARAL